MDGIRECYNGCRGVVKVTKKLLRGDGKEERELAGEEEGRGEVGW